MRLKSLDLNLLQVLQAVFQTGNVTKASEQLFMTQSAVSNALRRLRDRLGDPLFIRTSSGVVPTPYVESIMAPIDRALAEIDAALVSASAFDPLVSERTFRIHVNDLGQMVFLPALVQQVRRLAPGASLETSDGPWEDVAKRLASGRLDVVLGSWPSLGENYRYKELFREGLVVLMRSDHPLASAELSATEYLNAKHVVYRPSGMNYSVLFQGIERAAGRLALNPRIELVARHGLGLTSLVADTDLLLTVPGRPALAMIAGRKDLAVRPLPIKSPKIAIAAQWHAKSAYDEAAQWLREQVFALFLSARV